MNTKIHVSQGAPHRAQPKQSLIRRHYFCLKHREEGERGDGTEGDQGSIPSSSSSLKGALGRGYSPAVKEQRITWTKPHVEKVSVDIIAQSKPSLTVS